LRGLLDGQAAAALPRLDGVLGTGESHTEAVPDVRQKRPAEQGNSADRDA
jgi:hypothetical protein